MRILATVLPALLLLAARMAPVADGSEPGVPAASAAIRAFLPAEHVIEQLEEVDLDEDGLRDAALLGVPACSESADDLSERAQCHADGRFLLILFRQPDGSYRRSVSVGIQSGVGVHGDHFDRMQVRGRTVSLSGGGTSCAGQTGSDDTYQYRFQNDDWYLIGHVEHRWHLSDECDTKPFDVNQYLCPELQLSAREACVEVERSTNFNTAMQESKWSVTPRSDEGPERTVVRRKPVPRQPLRALRDEKISF